MSFNVMNDIIGSRSGRLDIKTYSAIQSIKYSLRAAGKTSIETFTRKDKLRDPVDRSLCDNFRTAWKVYKKEKEDNALTIGKIAK